jgi:2-keto-myo-inositol isomerase
MQLALHQNTSHAAGFRGSLEGWARAGITHVEITGDLLDGFLATESLASARRVLADLGLTPVSGASCVNGLLEPLADRPALVDAFKRRSEQWAALGIGHIYATTASTRIPAPDDYARAQGLAGEVADVAQSFHLTAMFEFLRSSTFVATLPTMLAITRGAARPNLGLLFDCYHFWSGMNRMEDLDAVEAGDIRHVHFQDVADLPRERLDATTREIAGDGVAPLVALLRALAARGYDGPLSVELFAPLVQRRDPEELAREIRQKSERVMRAAGVL